MGVDKTISSASCRLSTGVSLYILYEVMPSRAISSVCVVVLGRFSAEVRREIKTII